MRRTPSPGGYRLLAPDSKTGGIAGVEHDVAFGPSDEEGGNFGGADVVEIARNAERFRGPCPPILFAFSHLATKTNVRAISSPSPASTRPLARRRIRRPPTFANVNSIAPA